MVYWSSNHHQLRPSTLGAAGSRSLALLLSLSLTKLKSDLSRVSELFIDLLYIETQNIISNLKSQNVRESEREWERYEPEAEQNWRLVQDNNLDGIRTRDRYPIIASRFWI